MNQLPERLAKTIVLLIIAFGLPGECAFSQSTGSWTPPFLKLEIQYDVDEWWLQQLRLTKSGTFEFIDEGTDGSEAITIVCTGSLPDTLAIEWFEGLDSLAGEYNLGPEPGWFPDNIEQRLSLEGELDHPFDRYVLEWHLKGGTIHYPATRSDYIGFSGFVRSVIRRFERISEDNKTRCVQTNKQ